MLENASNMIDKATRETTATATASKARKITEILTSKTAQQLTRAATTILALPPLAQTKSTLTTASSTCNHATALLALKTRTSLKSLTSNDNTLTTASLSSTSSSSSLFTTETTENFEAVASYTSTSTTATLKAKDILKNLTPAYLLTTLAATIATHVKQKNPKSNSISSSNSNCTNSKNIQTATNKNVSCHMIQRHKNQNEFYHMHSLNHQNCSNVVQHHQQQRNMPQQQRYSNKYLKQKQQQQQQKLKQFLLLLTCFVAIITIFSLPHLSMAVVLTSHMSTTYATTTPTTKTIKSSTTATTTHEKLILFSSLTLDSSTDNENKNDDNSYSNNNNNSSYNKIADNSDNVDDLTSFSPLATTIENSLRTNSSSREKQQHHLENHIITRLIRSLDVSVNGAGGGGGVGAGSSSSSSMFSPSPGGSSGLTNIFNQNLDTGLSNNIECPSFDESSACPCYKFEDGLFLECPGTTATSLRTTLERISSPIHSLSIYDFDRSVTSLSQDVFQPGVNIRHLQFSHSHLETLKENSLKNVRASLESLSIVNGKLTQEITTSL